MGDKDRLSEIQLLNGTVTDLKNEISSIQDENKILIDNRNDLKKKISILKGQLRDLKCNDNHLISEHKSKIEEITIKYEVEMKNLRSKYELQIQEFRDKAQTKSNEVQFVGKKLEIALSSDIESRENYETFLKGKEL